MAHSGINSVNECVCVCSSELDLRMTTAMHKLVAIIERKLTFCTGPRFLPRGRRLRCLFRKLRFTVRCIGRRRPWLIVKHLICAPSINWYARSKSTYCNRHCQPTYVHYVINHIVATISVICNLIDAMMNLAKQICNSIYSTKWKLITVLLYMIS